MQTKQTRQLKPLKLEKIQSFKFEVAIKILKLINSFSIQAELMACN
jgi:hypothetical protein